MIQGGEREIAGKRRRERRRGIEEEKKREGEREGEWREKIRVVTPHHQASTRGYNRLSEGTLEQLTILYKTISIPNGMHFIPDDWNYLNLINSVVLCVCQAII